MLPVASVVYRCIFFCVFLVETLWGALTSTHHCQAHCRGHTNHTHHCLFTAENCGCWNTKLNSLWCRRRPKDHYKCKSPIDVASELDIPKMPLAFHWVCGCQTLSGYLKSNYVMDTFVYHIKLALLTNITIRKKSFAQGSSRWVRPLGDKACALTFSWHFVFDKTMTISAFPWIFLEWWSSMWPLHLDARLTYSEPFCFSVILATFNSKCICLTLSNAEGMKWLCGKGRRK